MQIPNANFSIKAPGGHQARDGGVKGHAPRRPPVAHQGVQALSSLHIGDVDVMVDMGWGHKIPKKEMR